VPALDLAGAKRIVAQRTRSHFRGLTEANALLQQGGGQFIEGRHDVASKYFDVRGRLRLDRTWVEEHSLLRREDSLEVKTIWRERGAGATAAPAKP